MRYSYEYLLSLFYFILKYSFIPSYFLSILSVILSRHSEITSTVLLPWLSCPLSWKIFLGSVFHNIVEKYNCNFYNRRGDLMITHYCLNYCLIYDKSNPSCDSTPSFFFFPANISIYNQFMWLFIVAFSFWLLNLS